MQLVVGISIQHFLQSIPDVIPSFQVVPPLARRRFLYPFAGADLGLGGDQNHGVT